MPRFGIARFFFLLALLICVFRSAQALTPEPVVYRLEIRDTIQPVTAGRLERALAMANRDHAAALLVDLDTPGGLLDSTRAMVGAILSSPVPVIVYISPAGARGGSAGFFLLEAADIAAMAPGTNAGASHPVLASGTPDEVMKAKMENDAAAFLRSYVKRHGRNAQVAEDAVRKSSSYSADEALAQHLIDVTAIDDRQLLAMLDGRPVTSVDFDGHGSTVALKPVVLKLKDARIITIEPTVRERVLGYLLNPNLALLLLVGGAMLIYLEFNVPGTVAPGALGTVMVLLSIFALDMLPVRHIAVALILAALVLILMELKFASHGILAIAGVACLAFGTLTLIDAPIPELRVQPVIAISLCVSFGLITLVLLRLAMAARRNKSLMGPAALVGSWATAMEPLWPAAAVDFSTALKAAVSPVNELHEANEINEINKTDEMSRIPGEGFAGSAASAGHILVQGEIWQAVAAKPVAAHTKVRVTGFKGDILEVQPVAEPVASRAV